jgi:PEP-CTERM motif-containing protein
MKTRFLPSVLALFSFVGLLARPALADVISNGDFGTGTLADWTVFTTTNGTNGAGLPDVASFNTTGSGATNSAQFNVGEVNFDGTQQGGGLSQTIDIATSGTYDFSAAIAAQVISGQSNADAGTFSLLIDGTTIASVDLGHIGPAFGLASTLNATLDGSDVLSAGTHDLEIEITRPFTSVGGETPDEYVTNISSNAEVSAVPEPTSLLLFGTVVVLVGLTLRRNRAASR